MKCVFNFSTFTEIVRVICYKLYSKCNQIFYYGVLAEFVFSFANCLSTNQKSILGVLSLNLQQTN